MEILTLLGQGLVKKEIASNLGISYPTVDSHVSHIYEKLNVHNAHRPSRGPSPRLFLPEIRQIGPRRLSKTVILASD